MHQAEIYKEVHEQKRKGSIYERLGYQLCTYHQ